MIRFGVIGTGWRVPFFLRIARACPDKFKCVGIVSRNPAKAVNLTEEFGVPILGSVDELLAQRPAYVITSVTWAANPLVVKQLSQKGIPILSETPPATTLAEMLELWDLAKNGAKIQVAEQFWAQPHHAARIAFAHSGKIGRVTQAQISVGHGYHGISLMRRYLGIGFESPTITARSFTSPIVKSPGREGPPEHESIDSSTQTIAHFDFGDRLGIFDFTGDQYFSYIRGQRVLVRGERGEIVDHSAVYLEDVRTPIQVTFMRQNAGVNGNLEGHHLKGIQAGETWIYRNPLAPGELSDEEVAIGTCMLRMGDYADGGPDVYSLAEASQDRYLDILMGQAVEQGKPIKAEIQPWTAYGSTKG